MSTTLKYILTAVITLAIAAGLVAAGYSWGKSKQQSKDLVIQTEYVHQIDSLKNVIDDITNISVETSKKCDSLQFELNTLVSKSQKLRQYYDEKIKDIASYNNTELQCFFTERYR